MFCLRAYDFEGMCVATFCYTTHLEMTPNVLENLSNMVRKLSQDTSQIDLEGALEAAWEPPLKQGASKISFLTMLASFWEPLWDQFGVIWGIIF